MKAMVYHRYGTPDEIAMAHLDRPVPKSDEVLVKVHAASVNSWDWDLLRGKPWLVRTWGLFRPKFKILGADIAGVIVETGSDVAQWKPGDEVFGDLCEAGWGGFAEYVSVPARVLMRKPVPVSFEEAAAVPQAGLLALQGLNDQYKIREGEDVLINGAGGGVGTFAVQLARLSGARITAVDRPEKLEMLRHLGAHHLMDCTKEDFTRNGKQYHFILDVAANRTIREYRRALVPGGRYVMVGGTPASIFEVMVFGRFYKSKRVGILFHRPNKSLDELARLLESGRLRPVIDRFYSLGEVPAALRRIGNGEAIGKLVIRIG